MFKIKTGFKQKRKKAQHIVEFAILMPIFIAFFCFMFPFLTINFRNFKFSYFASNLVTKAIENPDPLFYINKNEWNPERFSEQIEEALSNIGEETNIFLITKTPQVDFVSLWYMAPIRSIFGMVGKNYFYYMVPINNSYTEAPVFNIGANKLKDCFDRYYRGPQRNLQRKNSPLNNGKSESHDNIDEGTNEEGMDGALGG